MSRPDSRVCMHLCVCSECSVQNLCPDLKMLYFLKHCTLRVKTRTKSLFQEVPVSKFSLRPLKIPTNVQPNIECNRNTPCEFLRSPVQRLQQCVLLLIKPGRLPCPPKHGTSADGVFRLSKWCSCELRSSAISRSVVECSLSTFLRPGSGPFSKGHCSKEERHNSIIKHYEASYPGGQIIRPYMPVRLVRR